MLSARQAVGDEGEVVVLSGDVPLQSPELIADLVAAHRSQRAAATLLTTEGLDPTGYGRIVRAADGSVAADRRDQAHRRRPGRAAGHPRDQHRHLRLRRRRAVDRAGRGRHRARRGLPHRRPAGAQAAWIARELPLDRRRSQRHGRQRPRGPDGGRIHRPAPDPDRPRPQRRDV
ncbi:MAG: hypothetical protein WKF40_04000 [Thermoleophilaceae bacterium]